MKTNKPFFLISLTTLILFFFAGCQQDTSVPPHLIGVWKTSAPKYADRSLTFTDSSLVFGVGDGEEIAHAIEKIEVEEENNRTLYTFHYKDSEGEKWTLTLFYNPDSGGAIQLQNKDEIWKKVQPGGNE